MFLYFLLIRIAALFGHPKARKLVRGQHDTKERLKAVQSDRSGGLIWIHAASSGEFEQARTLIEKLKLQNPKLRIVVTFFSPSGYEMHKNYALADAVYYLPFATRRNARKFLDALQPSKAVFVKYEFWPAYIRELKKRDIPFYSICSIFRPEQYFFRLWGKGQLRLLRMFTNIYVQDEASRRLLAEHAVHNASVAGDTRFDRMKAVMGNGLRDTDERLAPIAEFAEGCERVIVAGSTWPKDEQLLHCRIDKTETAQALKGTKLILVPHELSKKHLHFIFNLFKGRMVKYSAITNDALQMTNESRRNILRHADVLLVDTMGLLSSIYRFGHVAYIGGGFGAGIHNTIEAAAYGLPVIFGPNYRRFREAQGLIDAGAGRSIRKYSELEDALETALANHSELGAKASDYFASELGATEKIIIDER